MQNMHWLQVHHIRTFECQGAHSDGQSIGESDFIDYHSRQACLAHTFCPDAQPSLLINRMLVDQLAVWMSNLRLDFLSVLRTDKKSYVCTFVTDVTPQDFTRLPTKVWYAKSQSVWLTRHPVIQPYAWLINGTVVAHLGGTYTNRSLYESQSCFYSNTQVVHQRKGTFIQVESYGAHTLEHMFSSKGSDCA